MVPVLFAVDDEPEILEDIESAFKKVKRKLSKLRPEHLGQPNIVPFDDPRKGMKKIKDFRRGNQIPIFILDIRMQGRDAGIDLLKAIRARRSLHYSPVVILSSFGERDLIDVTYRCGANSFVLKSDDPKLLAKSMERIIHYWLVNMYHSRPLGKKALNITNTQSTGGT